MFGSGTRGKALNLVPWNLRLGLPLALALVAILVTILESRFTELNARAIQHYQAEKSLVQALTAAQDTLSYLVNIDAWPQVKREMALLGSHLEIEDAFLFDEEFKFVAGSRSGRVGAPIDQALETLRDEQLVRLIVETVPSVLARQTGQLIEEQHDNHLAGIYPVVLGVSRGEHIRKRLGVLVAVKSLDSGNAEAHSIASDARYRLLLMTLTVFGLLSVTLHFLVSRRVAKVLTALKAVSRNDFAVCANVNGSDEIAQIASAIDETAVQLAASQELAKRQEAALWTAKERAEAASKAKSLFLANMSHELRTPLNGLFGMLESVIAGNLSSEQREQLQVANASAQALLRIIDDILDISRVEAGKLLLCPSTFDLRETIEGVTALFRPQLLELSSSINVVVAKTIPQEVVGDKTRLRQILINLLGNAIKFSPQHESIQLHVENSSADLYRIRFMVIDHGIGIAKDHLARIFDSFEQGDSSITRRFGGAGLGLAITMRLVELMNGNVSVQSEVGKGSQFTVEVPFETPPPPLATAERNAEPITTQPQSHSLFRVLLVEDNVVNRKVAEKFLSGVNGRVTIATNGFEALDAYSRDEFEVILMDCQMPGMDGFTATRAIREREKDSGKRTPIIALTAHALPDDRVKCLEAGMDTVVTKPFRREELHRVISSFLNGTFHELQVEEEDSPRAPGSRNRITNSL
jgi:signal transduction histidine kinase/FixJ family two-component response regulator